MQVGKLNKRVQIISRKAQTDDLGFDTLQDVVHCTCWASIEPARGKVFYGITHDMKVKYQDHLYDIDTIVDPYMRHESLELYCTEEIRGQDDEQR